MVEISESMERRRRQSDMVYRLLTSREPEDETDLLRFVLNAFKMWKETFAEAYNNPHDASLQTAHDKFCDELLLRTDMVGRVLRRYYFLYALIELPSAREYLTADRPNQPPLVHLRTFRAFVSEYLPTLFSNLQYARGTTNLRKIVTQATTRYQATMPLLS